MWYTSKEIREILKISNQHLYELKKHNKIVYKKIPNTKKYLFQLDKEFENEKHIAIYARVSTTKQKQDLENQISLLKNFLLANGIIVESNYLFSDIASGMNENRKSLDKLIDEVIKGNISKVYISHKDRLTRFGYGYLKNIFLKYNCEIIEINDTIEKTFQEELTEDLIAIIHHFSMKFYGSRKNTIKKLIEIIK